MAKLGFLSLIVAFVGTLAIVGATSQDAAAGKDKCFRTTFKTDLMKTACKKDQDAAKKAMKVFLKKAKEKDSSVTCNTCHSKLAPKYELKKDGLTLFLKHGGK